MPLPKPEPGLVVSYSYLWKDQRKAGEANGRKVRPCAIVLASTSEDGETIVYAVPITHAPPREPANAVRLPDAVKRRLGLDAAPSWIIATEVNRFVWPGYDLAPVSRDRPDVFAWGFLPTDVFAKVKTAIARCRAAGRVGVVDRG